MFGIMQGRLSTNDSSSPQAFPTRWQAEFDLAFSLGISHVEWLIPRDDFTRMEGWLDPKGVCEALKSTQVPVRSACLDLALSGQSSPDADGLSEDDFVDAVKFALKIGAEVIILPLVESQGLESKRNREVWSSRLKDLVQEIPWSEQKLAIEATLPQRLFRGFVDQSQLDLGFALDTGNLAVAGIDPVSTIKNLKSMVRCIHLKDRDTNGLPIRIGGGIVPFLAIFRVMREELSEPLLTLETPRPIFDAAVEVLEQLDAIEELWNLSAN